MNTCMSQRVGLGLWGHVGEAVLSKQLALEKAATSQRTWNLYLGSTKLRERSL